MSYTDDMGYYCDGPEDFKIEEDENELNMEQEQQDLQEILEQDPYKDCDCEICKPL